MSAMLFNGSNILPAGTMHGNYPLSILLKDFEGGYFSRVYNLSERYEGLVLPHRSTAVCCDANIMEGITKFSAIGDRFTETSLLLMFKNICSASSGYLNTDTAEKYFKFHEIVAFRPSPETIEFRLRFLVLDSDGNPVPDIFYTLVEAYRGKFVGSNLASLLFCRGKGIVEYITPKGKIQERVVLRTNSTWTRAWEFMRFLASEWMIPRIYIHIKTIMHARKLPEVDFPCIDY